MLLAPKNVKFKKMHRGRLKGKSCTNNKLCMGEYGIQALESAWITAKQIETVRRILVRYTKKRGKIWIKIFPDKSISARADESRMGSGKGAVKYWVACIKPGNLLFEMSGTSRATAEAAFRIARYKLPLKIKFIARYDLF